MSILLPRTLRFASLSTSSRCLNLLHRQTFVNKAMASALPVVVCGKSPQIAQSVKKGLEPEYEVIHVILNVAQGVSDIPALLECKTPPPSSGVEQIGSQNYSNPPVAIITGGGYGDDAFQEIYDAAKGKGKQVFWLRPDAMVKTPPLGPKYGEHMTERTKVCLGKLEKEGRLERVGAEEGDAVVFF